jgi:hypothetical protein
MYVIKGKRELQASIAAGLPIQIEVNAVPCIDREQAIGAAAAYGDGQIKSDG